jgi:hypothetical protein
VPEAGWKLTKVKGCGSFGLIGYSPRPDGVEVQSSALASALLSARIAILERVVREGQM